MSEHLPDWAREIFLCKLCCVDNHYYIWFPMKLGDYDKETTESMVSQLVAEWLELDKFNWNKLRLHNPETITIVGTSQKIRFFSDEV
jgi:hypothetical protein